MNVLIVAATADEVAPLTKLQPGPALVMDMLVTGVGMTATAFALGRHLATHRYDLIINAGIAGSFDRAIPLGTVVSVYEDTIAELGAEDGEGFLPITELGFGENTFSPPAWDNDNLRPLAGLPKVKGITVNCVHGNDPAIQATIQRFGPGIESMEGAAVFYAARQTGIPAIQLRAISNYVEKRNRANWQVGLAISQLNGCLLSILSAIA